MGSEGIRHVAQEEPNGCVAATLAMVIGVGYQTATTILADRKHGDCYSTVAAFQELWRRGWRTLPVGRVRNEAREVIRQYPPEPFADLHIVSVKVSAGSPVYHSVVWCRDGTVLDPLTEEAVHRRMNEAFPDACIVASVHRMSLLAHFDRVVLMVAGQIVDSGSAASLLARQPLFRAMVGADESSPAARADGRMRDAA